MEVTKNTYSIFKNIINYVVILLVILIICLIAKYCFMDQIQTFDNNVYNYVYDNLTNPTLTKIMKVITSFGAYWVLVPIALLLIICIKNKKYGLLAGTNLLFVFIANRIIKTIFDRERPISNFIVEHGYSFPSAHTMCSTTFYGFLVALIWYKTNNKLIRISSMSIYCILILTIGFSRIYLQAHYFTDVIFGIIFGLICLLIFIKILKNLKKEN